MSAALPVFAEPRPVELPSTLSEVRVDEHRRIYCRLYDACLDQAEAYRWVSFSCAYCPVRDELTMAERRMQAAALFRACVEQEMVK